jgi:hypothetical protein
MMIHVAIEAEAGVLLDNAVQLIDAARREDADACEALLSGMDLAWERIYAVFARMTERCDPYIYFNRVRPYIHGWANNPALGEGLVYEGVDKFAGKPQAFRGQTGSQSSIVPAMDALFGVHHSADPLKTFLDELHHYRPVAHRRFIEDLAAQSTLRDFVSRANSPGLRDAFNACLEQVARFRTRHLEYAANYINKQMGSNSGNDPDVGTGGTPFMRYLKKHRDENRAQLVCAARPALGSAALAILAASAVAVVAPLAVLADQRAAHRARGGADCGADRRAGDCALARLAGAPVRVLVAADRRAAVLPGRRDVEGLVLAAAKALALQRRHGSVRFHGVLEPACDDSRHLCLLTLVDAAARLRRAPPWYRRAARRRWACASARGTW